MQISWRLACTARVGVVGDASGGFDMDGVGSSCSLNSGRTSCLASGMVRANDNAGCTWNSNGGNSRTGITCCKD